MPTSNMIYLEKLKMRRKITAAVGSKQLSEHPRVAPTHIDWCVFFVFDGSGGGAAAAFSHLTAQLPGM